MKKYTNIINAFDGSLWYIQESKLNEITDFIERVSADKLVELQQSTGIVLGVNPFEREDDDESKDLFERAGSKGQVALIQIQGTIFPKANLFTRFSGGTSTDMLREQLKQAAEDETISHIVMVIDSPGGSAQGLPETAQLIREIRMKKPVIAINEGLMASAAYFIGSAASEVYSAPSGLSGNIGTMMVLQDASKAAEKEGVKFKVIRSTKLKGIGHPMEPLSKEAVDEFQRLVNKFNEQFILNVSLNRNITLEEAQKMADARIHTADDATDLGFVDGIQTLDDVLEGIEDNDTEAKFDALGNAYTNLVAKFEDFQLRANEQYETLNKAFEAVQQKHETDKIEAAVAFFTEGPQARFVPTEADTVRNALKANFEATYEAFMRIPEGTGAPKEVAIAPKTESGVVNTFDLKAIEAKAKEEGVVVAYDAKEAAILDEFGTKYLKGYQEEDSAE